MLATENTEYTEYTEKIMLSLPVDFGARHSFRWNPLLSHILIVTIHGKLSFQSLHGVEPDVDMKSRNWNRVKPAQIDIQ